VLITLIDIFLCVTSADDFFGSRYSQGSTVRLADEVPRIHPKFGARLDELFEIEPLVTVALDFRCLNVGAPELALETRIAAKNLSIPQSSIVLAAIAIAARIRHQISSESVRPIPYRLCPRG
jgi:hypothetical protein